MSQEWYYAVGGNQHGPFGVEQVRSKLAQGEIGFDTLVWKEGMSGWKKAQDVADFQNIQRTMPNAVIPPSNPPVASSQQSAQQIYNTPQANPHQMSFQNVPHVPTYLWQSIVCTLLCCLPFGIVGIVYASKVEGLLRSGNVAEAQRASDNAKLWCWLSFGFGLGILVLSFFGGMLEG